MPSMVSVENKGDFCSLLMRMQNCAAILENNLAVSYEVNIDLLYNPAVPLLGIYQKNENSHS